MNNTFTAHSTKCYNIYAHHKQRGQNTNMDKKAEIFTLANTIHWNRRNITPLGKICLIKSLFLAKINHILSILLIPNDLFVKELENMFYRFVWNNKPDKIKRSILSQQYKNGGIQMPILKKYLNIFKSSMAQETIKMFRL